MENNDLIYGKEKSNFILNETELQFIKNYSFSQIMNNEDKKMRLMNIFKKIGSLSIVQKDVYNILNSFKLNEAKNTNNYNVFINKFIQNQKIENDFRKNKEIGNSIFILYLLLNNIVKYVQTKKVNLYKNINSTNQGKINQAYKEIRFLIKKFLKLREKIYSITQLQYVEPSIPKNTNININFYYYHFYRMLIEEYILNENNFIYNYQNVINSLLFKNNNIVSKKNNSENINIKKQKIYNSNDDLSELNVYNLYSIYYIKENIHTIISKRNTNFYLYRYEINGTKIIKSENPENIYINEKNINQFLEKNSSKYGTLQKIFSIYE